MSTEMHTATPADFNIPDALEAAEKTYQEFLARNVISEDCVISTTRPKWAAQMLRKQTLADAVLDKIGSNIFVKRRPVEKADYKNYIERCIEANRPLQFRIPIGPVKNMNVCGSNQLPDLAEYLMFIQLARFASAIAALYPFGVKIQLVPDDVRATYANLCPRNYVSSYIAGLKNIVDALGFSAWLQVESGQMRLCDMYQAGLHLKEAEEKLHFMRDTDKLKFNEKWESALENARKNFVVQNPDNAEQEIVASAWRYLVAHLSEILSGMWSPRDAFPLVYANHSGNYQLFTMGEKKTKLPWQISIPVTQAKSPLIQLCWPENPISAVA